MNDCLKLRINQKQIWIMVMGVSLQELVQEQNLVYKILHKIGQVTGNSQFDNPDICDVGTEKEIPDYVVRLNQGQIQIIDVI